MTGSGRGAIEAAILPLVLFLCFTVSAQAQDGATLPEEEWYGDLKRTLVSHYTGKIVRLKMAIPATRRGLQIIDGMFHHNPALSSQTGAAQPGEELVIKNFYAYTGEHFDEDRMLHVQYPDALWTRIENFLVNLRNLPCWVDRHLSGIVFGATSAAAATDEQIQ